MLSKNEQEEIIRQHYHVVFEYCLLRTGDRETALDITQDTFTLMVKKAAVLTDVHMKSWLIKVAEYLCCGYRRRRRRENGQLHLDELEPEALNRIFSKLDDRSFGVYYETYQSILLRHLSAKEAYLCELRFIKGLSTAEIAELLQIRPAAVHTRVSRLKKRIERIIKEDIPFV